MPYYKPRRRGEGYVLPKKEGGVHESSSGKPVIYGTAEKATAAAKFINAIEHGFKPTKNRGKK